MTRNQKLALAGSLTLLVVLGLFAAYLLGSSGLDRGILDSRLELALIRTIRGPALEPAACAGDGGRDRAVQRPGQQRRLGYRRFTGVRGRRGGARR